MEEKDLIKDKWQESDKKDFLEYLESQSKGEKSSLFEKKILNTNLKCIAVDAKNVTKIVNLIYKGNFLSFIDLWLNDNNASLVITGKLIAKIKDFDIFKKYLLKYLELVDSWAHTDCLKLNIKEIEKEKYFLLASDLIKYEKAFFRRMGLIFLFKLIDDNYIDRILDICNSLFLEDDYYVNMANAWLVAECFVKYREKTLLLIQAKTLNKFVQNKSISKCSDSFRLSIEDKLFLKSFRK